MVRPTIGGGVFFCAPRATCTVRVAVPVVRALRGVATHVVAFARFSDAVVVGAVVDAVAFVVVEHG